MTSTHNHADLALLDYVEARRLLGHIASFCLLRPVYPSLGCGKLRVLRIRPAGGAGADERGLEVIAGYESYERIDL
jgi:hypothetical protein